MSVLWHPHEETVKKKGMQIIDLSKLNEADDPSYDEVLDAIWTYQKEGFEKNFEDILNKNKSKDLYYIAWMFKPSREHRRMIQSTFFVCDAPCPRMLCVTLFKVDNKQCSVDVLWALPYDSPQIVGTEEFKVGKLHPKIAESVQKSKHSYIFNNPLDGSKSVL
jgi:hypothetical protein